MSDIGIVSAAVVPVAALVLFMIWFSGGSEKEQPSQNLAPEEQNPESEPEEQNTENDIDNDIDRTSIDSDVPFEQLRQMNIQNNEPNFENDTKFGGRNKRSKKRGKNKTKRGRNKKRSKKHK
jgi:hypothetical protein